MSDLDLGKKEAATQHAIAEHVDDTSENETAPERPKSTKRMIFLGVYVGMAGWMYNFDLGEQRVLRPS